MRSRRTLTIAAAALVAGIVAYLVRKDDNEWHVTAEDMEIAAR